jgi:cysteinyl-tRNA synthetase
MASTLRPPPAVCFRHQALPSPTPPAWRFTVYNSLTRKLEPFVPLEPGPVRMYNCGPTVYGRAHIGNLPLVPVRGHAAALARVSGYEVQQVMNITDVGHLLDDADEGEDKIEAQARREKRDPWAISRGYTSSSSRT